MNLYPHWRTILRKAWSLKFGAAGIFFTCAGAILPMYDYKFQGHENLFATLTVICIAGAMISRLVAQQDV